MEATEGMPYRLAWEGQLICELLSAPAEELINHKSSIKSQQACKVSILVNPCRLSGLEDDLIAILPNIAGEEGSVVKGGEECGIICTMRKQ
jgi:hypothetical protein